MARSATAKQLNRIKRLARKRDLDFSRGTLLPIVEGRPFASTFGLVLTYPLPDQRSNQFRHSVLK